MAIVAAPFLLCAKTMAHPSLTIRLFESCDKARALDIWLEASAIAHPFFTAEQLREQQALVRDIYLDKAETWVAEADGILLGFIGLLDNWIGGLFVAPTAQRKGVGRALVEHASSLKGALALEVYEANVTAQAFYQRLGFEVTDRRETDDNGLTFPLLKMVRAEQTCPL